MSTKNTLDSERNSPPSSITKLSPYNDDDLDRFQRELNREKILDIWKKMREGGNSKDGIVTKEKFRQIFFEHFRDIAIKEGLVNDIFERFKKRDLGKDERNDKRRNDEKRNINNGDPDKGEIDLHDLVISLAVLSPMNYDDKLELCFDLTDIDEDGCLSPDDVCKMILAIERNFAKECSFIDPDNASSLNYVATKKALRRFNYIFLYEGQEEIDSGVGGKARKDKLLGHFKDFLEKLSNKQNLYKNLLPKNYSLRRVLNNRAKEQSFKIHKNEEDIFKKFRSELHGTLWGKGDSEPKYKNTHSRREEILKLQNKEPGDVASYGIRTIEEEPRHVEHHQGESLKLKEPLIQERSNLPEHKKRLKEMKERELPKLQQIMGNKYEKILKKKDSHLPTLNKLANETKQVNIETPDLSSMIEKRVERLKKEYKYLDPNYKDYLLNKLTSSINGVEKERKASPQRKIQAYKFLM